MQLKVRYYGDGDGDGDSDSDGDGDDDDDDGGGGVRRRRGGNHHKPRHMPAGAWFILSESLHRKSPALQQLGLNMLDWMWKRGWDEQHGGLFYFRCKSPSAIAHVHAYGTSCCCRDIHGKPVQE